MTNAIELVEFEYQGMLLNRFLSELGVTVDEELCRWLSERAAFWSDNGSPVQYQSYAALTTIAVMALDSEESEDFEESPYIKRINSRNSSHVGVTGAIFVAKQFTEDEAFTQVISELVEKGKEVGEAYDSASIMTTVGRSIMALIMGSDDYSKGVRDSQKAMFVSIMGAMVIAKKTLKEKIESAMDGIDNIMLNNQTIMDNLIGFAKQEKDDHPDEKGVVDVAKDMHTKTWRESMLIFTSRFACYQMMLDAGMIDENVAVSITGFHDQLREAIVLVIAK